MIFKLPSGGSVGRLFHFRWRWYSTEAATAGQPRVHVLHDYLINSLGFSEEEAFSTTQKVIHRKFSRNHPDSVVTFLLNLGLNKIQIKNIVKKAPRVLSYNVQKTLVPKIRTLQEIGISGSDLVKIMVNYRSVLDRNIASPVEYLRNLFGSDEKAAKAIKSYNLLLVGDSPRKIARNVELLEKYGFSRNDVCALLSGHPSAFFRKPEVFEEGIQRVENDFKISRDTKMFYQGVKVLVSLTKSTANSKLGILRKFGWSDAAICGMVHRFPSILGTSEEKI